MRRRSRVAWAVGGTGGGHAPPVARSGSVFERFSLRVFGFELHPSDQCLLFPDFIFELGRSQPRLLQVPLERGNFSIFSLVFGGPGPVEGVELALEALRGLVTFT